ncbi:MAG: DNA-binding protein [Lachnospiraceae bacterium]|nr:DNA-binding protein [Lachnospiraceae bacterium]MBR5583775.1 DNA-binding protein [Lachnospiraceae bacterium]
MDKILKQALLYDFYGELLTAHQKEIYEEVVLDDCSLSEVAESHGISRQGVHDLIKRCQKMLEGYEEKLMLVEKFCTIKEKIEQIEQLTNEVSEEPEKQLQEIKQYAAEILEEL